MATEYETPLGLLIPIPTDHGRDYGVHSVTHDGAKRYYVRANPLEVKDIELACELLDLKPGTFIMAVAASAAAKLKEHYDAHLAANRSGAG